MVQAVVFALAALGALTVILTLTVGLYAYRAYRSIVADLERAIGEVPPSRLPLLGDRFT